MSDRHQEALRRQEIQQRRLEEAMLRQKPQVQRDEQLKSLDEWLIKTAEEINKADFAS